MNLLSIMNEKLYQKAVSVISSKKFFYFIVILFALQASWIAVSGVFPMAFDEDYHFGLIQLYSHHLLPFMSNESPSAYIYGAVTRDPAYMYHYLMGFPYRLIKLFTQNQMTQVIILRLIDVALFAGAIAAFRKLLFRLKLSKTMTNLVLLFFVLTPIVPLLAAQINYDNLLILLTPITLILTLDFVIKLIDHKQFSAALFIGWLALSCFTSLVMYTFLPIFLSEAILIAYIILKHYKGNIAKALKALLTNYKSLSVLTKVGLVVCLIIGLGLFIERDGLNTIKYGTPTPECDQVLGIKPCLNFGTWARNYNYSISKGTLEHPTTYQFTRAWIHTMFYNFFYAINGKMSGFFALPPLPLPEFSAAFIALLGVFLVIFYRKAIFRKNLAAQLFLLTTLVFVVILWLQNYSDYHHLDAIVGVNGRYLVPILPLMLGLIALGFSKLLWKTKYAKALLTIIVLLMFLDGGGLAVFIIRSNNSWYWNNSIVQRVNNDARSVLKPITIGSNLPNV